MQKAIIDDPATPIEQDYSQELKKIISQMLIKDPEERPSIKELIQVKIIRDSIISFVREFEGEQFFQLRASLLENDSSFDVHLLSP